MSQPSGQLDVFWLKLVMFWDVNPILRLCEPLSCIFYCFCINDLLCLVYSERVARRVMNSGVWPLSCVLNVTLPLICRDFCKAFSLRTFSFQGKFCPFRPRI